MRIQAILRYKIFVLSALVLSFYSMTALAEPVLMSDWIKAKSGSEDEALGAQVVHVEKVGENTEVDVEIPVENLDDYETVIVIGEKPEVKEKRVKLVKSPQWLHDDENEPYGLRFYVEGVPDFEFRIFLHATE